MHQILVIQLKGTRRIQKRKIKLKYEIEMAVGKPTIHLCHSWRCYGKKKRGKGLGVGECLNPDSENIFSSKILLWPISTE